MPFGCLLFLSAALCANTFDGSIRFSVCSFAIGAEMSIAGGCWVSGIHYRFLICHKLERFCFSNIFSLFHINCAVGIPK